MTDTGPVGIASTVTIAGHPLHPLFVTVPIGLWVGTLICDIAFVSTGDGFWARAALVVLISAIVFALVAALAGFADFFGMPRSGRSATPGSI